MTTGAPFLVHTSLCSHCCQDSNAPSLSKCLCCLLLQSCQVLLQPVGGCGAAHTHLASQLHHYWGSFSGSHISVQPLLSGFQCTKSLKMSLLPAVSLLPAASKLPSPAAACWGVRCSPHTPCITALAKLGRFSQQAHHCEGVAERVQVHSAVCTAAPKACAKRWAVQTAALLVAVQPEIWIPA